VWKFYESLAIDRASGRSVTSEPTSDVMK